MLACVCCTQMLNSVQCNLLSVTDTVIKCRSHTLSQCSVLKLVCSLHCVSKNAQTLASCSFDKYRLILIIFSKRHQHALGNDLFCLLVIPVKLLVLAK